MSSSRSSQRALVVEQDPQVRATLQRVIGATSYDVHAPTEALDALHLEDYALMVIGTSSLQGELAEQLQAVRARRGPLAAGHIVLIDESPDRRAALETICALRADRLLPRASLEDILLPTVTKLLSEDYLGLEKYLASGTQIHAWNLTSSDDKRTVIDQVEEIANDASCNPRVIDLLASALDEMVINALYRPEAETARVRPSQRQVTVRCGSDGRFLGVSVLDELGSFLPEDLFRGLATALEREHEGIPPGMNRASLGFRVMLTTLSHLAIGVDPQRCTELIGLVDLRKSLADYRAAVPSLGIFTRERA